MNIAQNIENVRITNGISQTEMAALLGISQQVYSNLVSGRTKKIDPKYIEIIKEKLRIDILQHKVVNAAPLGASLSDTTSDKKSNSDSLSNLAESNRVLANSNLIFAEAHKLIAETNAKLTTMLKASLTVGGELENQATGPSEMDKVLEVLSVVASGKKWPTKEMAELEFRKKIFGDLLAAESLYHE